MRKVAVVVVVLVVLAMAGMFLVGRFVMSSGSSVAEAIDMPVPPEWAAYQRASEKGEEGWGELQDLMTTPVDAVAQQAAVELFGADEEAALLFFDKLPEVSTGVKTYLRSNNYNDWQFKLAWKEVAGPEGATRDGAALFLRLPYSRTYLDEQTRSGIGDTLVGTIPDATGSYASDLAFTIGLYPPSSLDGLKKHLGSGEARVRLIAVQALGRLEDETVLDEVKQMQFDSADEVRQAAIVATTSIEAALSQRLLIMSQGDLERANPGLAKNNAKRRLGMP